MTQTLAYTDILAALLALAALFLVRAILAFRHLPKTGGGWKARVEEALGPQGEDTAFGPERRSFKRQLFAGIAFGSLALSFAAFLLLGSVLRPFFERGFG